MSLNGVPLSRRQLIAGGLTTATLGLLAPSSFAQVRAKIVILGGGFGGAIAARKIRSLLPQATISLIESNKTYTACPFSNLVIGGQRTLAKQRFSYDGIAKLGINVIHQRAVDVDPTGQTVTLADGVKVPYDRLIMSPGIDIQWGALEGYELGAEQYMPHAWKAGAQTELLKNQLETMEDGGLVVISSPPAPFRCPPGPYERASLVASYLKKFKQSSKLIILDSKDSFSKMPLFLDAWQTRYAGLLEWRGASDDGRVVRVDPKSMIVETDFDSLSANVVNIIPPQQAGAIAHRAGVTDASGWCPIDPTSFESRQQKNIHIIGDAIIAAPMPKSAFSANLQGKVCAIQIARLLSGLEPASTILTNTCYSFIDDEAAVSITGVYNNTGQSFESIAGAGGLSPSGVSEGHRQIEALEARDWFSAITSESFG